MSLEFCKKPEPPLLGQGARTEPVGIIGQVAPWPRGSKFVSTGGGGGYLPRLLHGKISALIPSGPVRPPGTGSTWP